LYDADVKDQTTKKGLDDTAKAEQKKAQDAYDAAIK